MKPTVLLDGDLDMKELASLFEVYSTDLERRSVLTN
jgi:hypothetical protein